jgi:hypothetical protein
MSSVRSDHPDAIDRMNRFVQRMNEVDRNLTAPYVAPKDAATLILVDRSGRTPQVLLGKRHADHKFMPGKFVFPGGRVDRSDRRMPVARPPTGAQPNLQAHPRPNPRRRLSPWRRSDIRRPDCCGFGEECRRAERTMGGVRLADLLILPTAFRGRAITRPADCRGFDARFLSPQTPSPHGSKGDRPRRRLIGSSECPTTRQLDMPAVTGVMLEGSARHRRRFRRSAASPLLHAAGRYRATCGSHHSAILTLSPTSIPSFWCPAARRNLKSSNGDVGYWIRARFSQRLARVE